MLVKFANIVAIGFAAFGIQQTIATPVHDTETHDIARRSKSLKCGWVKSKGGKDLGCLCDSVIGNINADFDVSDVLSLLFTKGSKNYPPGCKPTCDGNGGYECPNGKDSKGNCLDDHGCEGGSCWDKGKCCPGGMVNKDGICCPPGCENKNGKCHVPEPPKQTCGMNEVPKDGMCKCKDGFSKEHDKAPCMPNCPHEQKRVGEHCVCKNGNQELYKGACKDKCKPTEKRNAAGHCEPQCPKDTTHNGKECVCNDKSKKLVNGHCESQCPKDTTHNGKECVCNDKSKKLVNGHCEPICTGKGQVFEHGKCVCSDKSKKLVNGHCEDKCPAPQQMYEAAHDKCVCTDKSKMLVNGHCENKCPAPEQMYEAAHDKCVCTDKSKQLKDGKCQAVCPADQTPVNGKCACKDNKKELVKGHCETKCPPDQWRNHEGVCVCQNKDFKPDHEKVCRPQCKEPQVIDKKTNTCKCPPHLPIYEHGKCKAAPPDCKHPKELNHEKTACVCAKGYKENHEKKCVLDCKDGKVPDHEGKMCVCPAPKMEKGGKCVMPPPECKHPKELNHEKTACVCAKGYKENHEKKCVLDCKDGKVPDHEGKMCICAAPKMEDKHGKCVDAPKCTHPEKLNTWTNKCDCADGYKRDWTGKCIIKCKGDKMPDHEGKMCVCPAGKVEKQNNKNKCVDPAPTCTHPEKLSWNGKKCVCEDGFKRNEHGVCAKDCGRGKKWCKTKCCREDQEEKDNGQCGCPHDWKDMKVGPLTICKPPVLAKIL